MANAKQDWVLKCSPSTQLSHAIHSRKLTVTSDDTCHVIKMSFLRWNLVLAPLLLAPLVWFVITNCSAASDIWTNMHWLASCWCSSPVAPFHSAGHPCCSYPCISLWELLMSGSPTFVLLSLLAALLGALSKACQPCSFQWLSILTSCP